MGLTIFHIYDIGQFHVKQQKKIAMKDDQVEKITEPKVKHLECTVLLVIAFYNILKLLVL